MIHMYIEHYYNRFCKWCKSYENIITLFILFCSLMYTCYGFYMKWDIQQIEKLEKEIDMNATFFEFPIGKYLCYELIKFISQFVRSFFFSSLK